MLPRGTGCSSLSQALYRRTRVQATWLAEWAVCVVSEPARDSLTSVELGLSVRKGRADAYG